MDDWLLYFYKVLSFMFLVITSWLSKSLIWWDIHNIPQIENRWKGKKNPLSWKMYLEILILIWALKITLKMVPLINK